MNAWIDSYDEKGITEQETIQLQEKLIEAENYWRDEFSAEYSEQQLDDVFDLDPDAYVYGEGYYSREIDGTIKTYTQHRISRDALYDTIDAYLESGKDIDNIDFTEIINHDNWIEDMLSQD